MKTMAGITEERVYRSELDRLHLPENQLDVVRVRLKPDVPLYSSRPITTSGSAVSLIADELKDYDREVFCVLNLNTKGIPMNMNIVSMGTIDEAPVHPRELFKSSILSSSSAVIFFHNHPSSGDPNPSQQDIDTTRRLVNAAGILGIRALDHIIVGKDGDYFSFKENGLVFDEPQTSSMSDEEAGYTADREEPVRRQGKNRKQSFREKVAEAFVQSLEENPREWSKNWASNDTGRPLNMASGRPYRGLNMAFLKFMENIQGFHDPRWLTYKQATDAGYKIPKGTKMTPVEYYFMYDHLIKKTIPWSRYNALSEDEKNQRVNTASGKIAAAGVTGTAIKPRFELRHRDHYVFNASQLEGVPEFTYERAQNDIAPSEVVEAVADGMGVSIEHKEQDRAFYSPLLDRITLPLRSQFHTDYDYQSTAMHELGHASGHSSRLNRNIRNSFGTEEYAYEELIAEITSCYMGEYIPQPMSEADMDNHLAYVQDWARHIKEDASYLFKAIREAEKAADYMILIGGLEQLKEKALQKNAETEKSSEPAAYDQPVLPPRVSVAEPKTAYYNSIPPGQRPPYRIAIYTKDMTAAEIESAEGSVLMESGAGKVTALEYLHSEAEARRAMQDYQSSASYQKMLDDGEMPYSQIALEHLQYDKAGEMISRELIDYTPKPLAYDINKRDMDLFDENGAYFVRFHSESDLRGITFCYDEAAKSFLTGFKDYFKSVIDSDLEKLLQRQTAPLKAYQICLASYAQGARFVLEGALPDEWRLSFREGATAIDYFERELHESIGHANENRFAQQCFQEVLAERGYSFRTVEEAQEGFREMNRERWHEKMMSTLVRARSTLVYAGEDI